MSHIATALAKSQGRDVKPPPGANIDDVPLARVGPVANPFLHTVNTKQVQPVVHSATEAQPAPRSAIRVVLLALGVSLVAALGLAAWMMRVGDNPLANFFTGAQSTPSAAVVPSTKRTTPATQTQLNDPSAILQEKVRGLVITSAAGGAIQRVTIGGKVFQPGETVVDGLVLQSIENDAVIFRDSAGHLYPRHR